MLGSEQGIVQNEPTEDQEAKPDSNLVGHSIPKRKVRPDNLSGLKGSTIQIGLS